MKLPKSVLVVGAGVVGMATAYAFARRGIDVTVVDRNGGPGLGASHANGAQLSYYYTDALASPKLLRQLPRLACGFDEAFRLRPAVHPDFLMWAAAFLRNCTAGRFRLNTLSLLSLGLQSRAAMAELLERHPLAFGHAVPGKLLLYRDRAAFDAALKVLRMKADHGAQQLALSPEEALAVEPALRSLFPHLAGAIHSLDEGTGDAHLFTSQLRSMLETEYGVISRFDFPIDRVRVSADKAVARCETGEEHLVDHISLCTGIDANRLLRPFGIRLPIWPMKGYSFTAPIGANPPRVSLTDIGRRIVFSRLGGFIRVAGLAELGNRDSAVDPRRMAHLIEAARQALPDAADFEQADRHWAGLRPMTPDSRPRISCIHRSLSYNVGHGMLGWTMAMGSAERLASAVAAKSSMLAFAIKSTAGSNSEMSGASSATGDSR
jgi:D-amino-acid dehydrogenase